MAFKALTSGYTGKLEIKNKICLVNSFDLSMSKNYLKSSGMFHTFHREGKFKKLQGMRLRDYATFDLSVGIDIHKNMIDDFINHIVNNPHGNMNVRFTDLANQTEYNLEAYIQSFSLSVSEGQIATVSVSFFSPQEHILINFQGGTSIADNSLSDETIKGDDILMPYWKFGIDNGLFDKNCVISFNITWSQNITPNFECCASAENTPQDPDKLIFGIPECKYDITYLLGDSNIQEQISDVEATDIIVKYGDSILMILRDAIRESYSPSLMTDSYCSLNISGTVTGEINNVNNSSSSLGDELIN